MLSVLPWITIHYRYPLSIPSISLGEILSSLLNYLRIHWIVDLCMWGGDNLSVQKGDDKPLVIPGFPALELRTPNLAVVLGVCSLQLHN